MAPAIKNTMFGKYFKHVLVLTFLAGIAYSLPQVKEAMAGAFAFTYTENSAAVVQATVKNQVLIHGVTAKVNYDSSHKESNLILTAKATVTAGTSDITVGNSLFSFILKNKTLNVDAAQINSSILSTSLKKNADGTYTVKKGTKATFVGSNDKFNPQQLIAGQYYATVVAVNTTTGKIIPSSNKSNPVTVVGEASPYITLSGKGIYGINNKVNVNGVRLGKEIKVTVQSQDVTGFSKTFKINIKDKQTQFSFNLADYGVVPGNYYLYVVNTKLGDVAGKSNNVSFSVLNQDRIINAKVAVGTLALSFDSAKKESLLSAPFLVTIKAGKEKLAFNDVSFYVTARNELGNERVAQTVIKYVNKVKPTSLPFVLNPGTEATFEIVSGVNPQTLFAGNYTMSVGGVYPANNGTTSPLFIQIPNNKTNSVAILGESSPYINSVTNPVAVGSKLVINGFRMAGAQVLIDGAALANTIVVGSVDGTVLQFDLPMLTNGFHQLSVRSSVFGDSNTVYFESTGGTDVPPVVVCPAGYICEPVPPTTPQIPDCPKGYTCTIVTTPSPCYVFNYNLTLGNTGADVAALQTLLITKGFNIPDITSGQNAPGTFGATTKEAVILYQASIGQPATGFVGPLTRAVLNACVPTVPTPTYPGFFITLSKSSYSANEKVVAKINRADGNTNPYYVDVYVFGPNLNIPTYSLKKNVGIGQDTEISFQMDQLSPVYSGPGYYSLLLCDGGQKCDGGRNTNAIGFEVKAATVPSITVVSPNGGESYITGESAIRIRYNSNNIAGSELTAYLYSPIHGNTRSVLGVASASGSIDMLLAKGVRLEEIGQYKITLCALGVNNPAVPGKPLCDSSDNYFTLTKGATPPDNSSNSYSDATPVISFVSASTDVVAGTSANDDVGTFNIKFKVTAVGDDIYLPSNSSSYTYRVDRNGVAVVASSTSSTVSNNTNSSQTANGNYLIEEGESQTLTLTVSAPLPYVGTAGQYRVALTGIKWGTTDSSATSKTLILANNAFVTNYVVLN